MTPEEEPEDQFSGVLNDLGDVANGEPRTTVGEVVDALGRRGTGPILVLLSAVLILPVGMIPGMPGLVALILMLIGLQMLLGNAHLWMPPRLRRIEVSTETLQRVVDHAQPWRHKIRLLLSERLITVVDSSIVQIATSLILIMTGGVIFFIGFVPGLPFVLSIHVLLIGLGMTARDGVVISLGLATIAPAVWLIGRVLF